MLRNTSNHWGLVSQLLHWLSAGLVLYLLVHGWWMKGLAVGADRPPHLVIHASAGYVLLGLVVMRMVWRSAQVVPAHPAGAPLWERRAARVSHVALYFLLLTEAYIGWALAGTLSQPLDRTLFNLVRVPLITRPGNRDLHGTLASAHEVFAWILAALIVVHVVAAIYHWTIRRDGVMQRMLPRRPGDGVA